MATKTKIRFLQAYTVQDEHAGTSKETTFTAGRVYSLTEDSAAHFISRGLAVDEAERLAAQKAADEAAAAEEAQRLAEEEAAKKAAEEAAKNAAKTSD